MIFALWIGLIFVAMWLSHSAAKRFGWPSYLLFLAVLIVPAALAVPHLNGNASAGNFGPDLLVLYVLILVAPLSAISGAFGLARRRAVRQWQDRHGDESGKPAR